MAEREATGGWGPEATPPLHLHAQAQMGIKEGKPWVADSAGICCVSGEGPFPSLGLGFLSIHWGLWEHVKGPSWPNLEAE